MKDILVDIRKENTVIRNYFVVDLVSVDDLLGTIEDLLCEIGRLEEKIEDKDNGLI